MYLVDKYKPKKSSEIIGQSQAISKLKNFILDFKNKKKKSVLIYGPPGTGKTSCVYALAYEFDSEILEVNASSYRNRDQIEEIIGSSSKQLSLFKKNKIILVDEIDGLSGTSDRGGIQALIKIIETSNFPIVLTATDPWSSKLSTLRRKTDLIEFNSLDHNLICGALRRICISEKIKFEDKVLKSIAIHVNGDLRAAINDLDILIKDKKSLKEQDLGLLSHREQKKSILNALKIVFKGTKLDLILNAFENTNMDLDECFLWLDENLPREYKGNDLIKAYEMLSKADVFRGRILRRQYYRFLVYQNSLMTMGISKSKDKINYNFVAYKRTDRILKLWIAKQKYAKRKAIAEKIGFNIHTSSKKVIKDVLPYLKIIFSNDKGNEIAEEIELEKEEIGWLRT